MAIIENQKINISGTYVRNLEGAKIVDGKEVEGGYFVCESLPSWGTVGQLCYCTGTTENPINKFYQYNGTEWAEADLGGVSDYNDLTNKPIESESTNNSLSIVDPNENILATFDDKGLTTTEIKVNDLCVEGNTTFKGYIISNTLDANTIETANLIVDNATGHFYGPIGALEVDYRNEGYFSDINANKANIFEIQGSTISMADVIHTGYLTIGNTVVNSDNDTHLYIEGRQIVTLDEASSLTTLHLTVDGSADIKDSLLVEGSIGTPYIISDEADIQLIGTRNIQGLFCNKGLQFHTDNKLYFTDSPNSPATTDEVLTLGSLEDSASSTPLASLVVNNNPTLEPGITSTIGSIDGIPLTVKLSNNLSSGSGSSTSTDTKVVQAYSDVNQNYPLLFSDIDLSTNDTTMSRGASGACLNNKIYAIPYQGRLVADSFYATSDRRLKENIKEFKPKKSILDLPVVEFDFKDSGNHQIGCIAQDLQEICPEIVGENADGFLNINESKLTYLLLLEVKKLKEELDELKNKVK